MLHKLNYALQIRDLHDLISWNYAS